MSDSDFAAKLMEGIAAVRRKKLDKNPMHKLYVKRYKRRGGNAK